MRKLTIRDEVEGDAPAIHALTRAAFANDGYSSGNEHDIVDSLRADGDLVLSLVATNLDEAIVGHIAISPITISDGSAGWFAGGPVSVMPTRQRTGIGSQLVEESLVRLEARGARGLVLLGDPGYYTRFGFSADPELVLPGALPGYFQVRMIGSGPRPKGEVSYAPGFSARPVA
ncbi:GNAT family N-acetyltransferase [Alteriqipengyuania lutimaris]|uniref:N-acetyltransferase n=1 Tax=Alteriqipengyuania lutimaris TaxID=1538146 RepID=A0A395LJ09_9SPHN|nr:N-acetyltransferase [Alteriqipengyuania lutimaris]MBB3034170.1 putative acetyltransferase [Alteriqipengyuania lutimaris]RDS76902.1 N-acetyltransferase [Alteriqipengyuania lutimaris]